MNGKEATVTFDSAGGIVVNSVKVKVNDNVSKPVNPTREGYNFVRWELDDKEYDFTDKVTSNITLKAVWEKKSDSDVTYTITLDIDGKTENVKVTDGKINSLPSPSKEGYVFVGWYDGSKKVSVGDTITKDITLTAKFEKKSTSNVTEDDNTVKYTVTFDSNGGSKVSSQTVVENKKVSKPKDPTATTGQNNNTGDVIIIEENASYQNHVIVNITGGTFESVNGYIIQEYNPILGTENELTSVITGLYTVKNNISENTFYYTMEE